jgi:AraC-like DNA-binding protein
MKPVLEDIKCNRDTSSVYAFRFQVPFFEFRWHYHPEYEITYIVKGSGSRLVGNCYETYNEGDFVLLGSDLPHTWSSKSTEHEFSEAIVIQFSKACIEPFIGFVECQNIKTLLEQSERGIQFHDTQALLPSLLAVLESHGMERIIKLLSLLEILSDSSRKFITENTYQIVYNEKSERRINKVCLFIQNNYTSKITLKEVADSIHMSESNFCKFFKKATGKTFSDYLNEMRINEACRLITQTDHTINQIAFQCGFETLSYFNRVFVNKKKMTPSNYRKFSLLK